MIQNNCKIIGLTGGIATGKSTVSNILKKKGYPIIDADKIARKVVEVNKPAYNKIIETFGVEIIHQDKTINRKLLGKIIFSNKEEREKLNEITHPYIFESIKSDVDKLSKENKILFLDIPLLFEQYELWSEYEIVFDEIWLVYLELDVQLERLMARDGIPQEEALRKIESQMDMEYKKTRSSKLVNNGGDVECLEKQIDKLLIELI